MGVCHSFWINLGGSPHSIVFPAVTQMDPPTFLVYVPSPLPEQTQSRVWSRQMMVTGERRRKEDGWGDG